MNNSNKIDIPSIKLPLSEEDFLKLHDWYTSGRLPAHKIPFDIWRNYQLRSIAAYKHAEQKRALR